MHLDTAIRLSPMLHNSEGIFLTCYCYCRSSGRVPCRAKVYLLPARAGARAGSCCGHRAARHGLVFRRIALRRSKTVCLRSAASLRSMFASCRRAATQRWRSRLNAASGPESADIERSGDRQAAYRSRLSDPRGVRKQRASRHVTKPPHGPIVDMVRSMQIRRHLA